MNEEIKKNEISEEQLENVSGGSMNDQERAAAGIVVIINPGLAVKHLKG